MANSHSPPHIRPQYRLLLPSSSLSPLSPLTTSPPPLPPSPPPFTPRLPPPESYQQFSTIYSLALADRMRQLSSLHLPFPAPFPPFLAQGPPSMPLLAHRFSPPADLALFPMAKLDPRLFRMPFPEEPKPQHSYIGLISMGILSNPDKKLVLADIYQYILDNYLYFRHRGPGWRNSIRHNLSLNDCFIKSGRAANGKGHYWAVHPACVQDFQKGDFRRRRAQRKVRRHMGLHSGQDDEEEDTPPTSPLPFSLPTEPLPLSSLRTEGGLLVVKAEEEETTPARHINFGVDFLLSKCAGARSPSS